MATKIDCTNMSYRELQTQCKLVGKGGDGSREDLIAKLNGEDLPEIPVDPPPEPEPEPETQPHGREDSRFLCGGNWVRLVPERPHGIDILNNSFDVVAQVRMRKRDEIGRWVPLDNPRRFAVLAAFADEMYKLIESGGAPSGALRQRIEGALSQFGG